MDRGRITVKTLDEIDQEIVNTINNPGRVEDISIRNVLYFFMADNLKATPSDVLG